MKQKFYTTVLENYIDRNDYYGSVRCKKSAQEKEFDTYEEAAEAAKKTVMSTKDDVVIYKIAGVAKFPVEDIKVVEVV